jgi:DNA-binding GntR family transcriptional regulator
LKAVIQSQPLYQQTYEAIKEAILKGEIKSGSKIVATKLCEQFGVGRTPLREALRQLTNEGLLVQDQTFLRVVSLDQRDFEELLYCRLLLEKDIIRLAVPNISERQIEEAEAFLRLSEEAYRNKVNHEVLEYNTKFHEVLINACPNQRLVELMKQTRFMLLLYRANILHYHYYNNNIFVEHRNILEAIKERNVEKAVQMVEYHLLQDLNRGKEIISFQMVQDPEF